MQVIVIFAKRVKKIFLKKQNFKENLLTQILGMT